MKNQKPNKTQHKKIEFGSDEAYWNIENRPDTLIVCMKEPVKLKEKEKGGGCYRYRCRGL